ncbi:MAG TPA: phosphotransferase [Candidatus Cloacimonadota bacterium]|nr:phosphotransferase [Candidatus Cloacimonadota bacterium]
MKNDVILEKFRVIKTFNSEEYYNRELLIYKLNLPYIPDMLEYNSNPESEKQWIILHRLYGHNPQPGSLDDFQKALYTLIRFHRDLKNLNLSFSHNDPNPKNFIIEDDKCYLFDFSDISQREAGYDILAFFLFTVDFLNEDCLKQLIEFYTSHFSFDYRICLALYDKSILEFDQRRAFYKNINTLTKTQLDKRELIRKMMINK